MKVRPRAITIQRGNNENISTELLHIQLWVISWFEGTISKVMPDGSPPNLVGPTLLEWALTVAMDTSLSRPFTKVL